MLTVLLLLVLASGLVAITLSTGVQKAFVARSLADQTRAMAIAEAGASEAFAVLAQDIKKLDDPSAFPRKNYAGGSYDATVALAGGTGPLLVVVCTGVYAQAEEYVVLDLHYEPAAVTVTGGEAYDCSIIANQDVKWTGCGEFHGGGKLHTNAKLTQSGSGELDCDCHAVTEIRLNGKSGGIYADVYSPVVCGKTGKITGTIYRQPVDVIELPDINLVPYIQHAIRNGQAYSNGLHVSTGDFHPTGGIAYITGGDLQFSTHGNISGCFITDNGRIKLTSQVNHTKVNDYPAFVSWNRDIEISGGGSYEGLIYAVHGNIKITGGCTVNGQLMTGGTFDKGGCSSIFNYAKSIPIPPDGSGTDQVLALSAWQK